jgi:hypothetical protein
VSGHSDTPSASSQAHSQSETSATTEGQRRINLIWESTQAVIALSVTGAVIYAAIAGVQEEILSNAFTLVIAVYFVRMNHIKTGGVGGADKTQGR